MIIKYRYSVRLYSKLNWKDVFSYLNRTNNAYKTVTSQLKEAYNTNLLPLEKSTLFHELHSPMLFNADFEAKPFVLLMGQYSTGKTTLIRFILHEDFPGMRIGPEPTTDKFMTIMHGAKSGTIPGNALASDNSKPFVPLSKFGTAFLNKLECSLLPSPILKSLNIIDTPGILSGEKQRVDRGYDFAGVLEWFAARVDRIILLFDANKLDISDEFKGAIEAIKGNEEKVRIVLNKSDSLDLNSLMRVYGSLMWSLGKVLKTPEVCRVYIGSFWDKPYMYSDMRKLFEKEEKELLTDLQNLHRDSLLRKLNDIMKRTRLLKVHALVMDYLYSETPKFFFKSHRRHQLIDNLQSAYDNVQKKWNIAPGDFVPVDIMKERLKRVDLTNLSSSQKQMSDIEKIHDKISEIMNHLNSEACDISEAKGGAFEHLRDDSTPFGNTTGEGFESGIWENEWPVTAMRGPADATFDKLVAFGGKLSRATARTELLKSGLPSGTLGQVYCLADTDNDGLLNRDEFALAHYIIQLKIQGFELPQVLPVHLTPPKNVQKS